MSNEKQSTSVIVQFLDAFLQERNIKYLLAVGMVILFSSSLLLVTTHWDEYPILWQNLIVLAYTAVVYGAGQWTYHRLGLRRTGVVLQGLTVLLIPVLFLVVRWIPVLPGLPFPDPGPDNVAVAAGSKAPNLISHLCLLAITTGFSMMAARRIFAFFLRTTQPTFLVCYLILSLAGALLGLAPADAAPWLVASLWCVFAVGAIKVSRHIFWLTEEHRAPRILGFLPILLLGAQFLFLYCAHPALHIGAEWLGFGCVLVALPILATADAVARVFQQRTGDLVRPLPWAIMLPMVVGLVACAAGVSLSAMSLVPPNRPYALVATALVASGLMIFVARRTGQQAFVWATLFGLTCVYQFSPMFFMQIVIALRDRGAELVGEQRLPFAFYGLTYFPLLAGLLIEAYRLSRRGDELFARPIRLYAFGLTCLLGALSVTNDKAMFPVGLSIALIAILQVRLLRFWPALIPALLAWVSAAYGLSDFASKIFQIEFLADAHLVCLAGAAAILLAVGRGVDGWVARILPPQLAAQMPTPCQSASSMLTFALAGAWFVPGITPNVTIVGLAIGGLLVLHAFRTGRELLCSASILFLQAIAMRALILTNPTTESFITAVTLGLLLQWFVGSLLERLLFGSAGATFASANRRITAVWLSTLALGMYLPLFLADLLASAHFAPAFTALPEIAWPCRVLMALWTLDLARRFRSVPTTTLAYVAILGGVGSAWLALFGTATLTWLPAVWSGTVLTLFVLADRWTNRLSEVRKTTTWLNAALFALIACSSLALFTWPMRVAGAMALAGLIAMRRREHWNVDRLPLAILFNVQVFCLIATLISPGSSVSVLTYHTTPFALPFAFVAAASLVAWQFIPVTGTPIAQAAAANFFWILRATCVGGLACSIGLDVLTPFDILLAGGAFLLLAASELLEACGMNSETRVWTAEAILAAGALYFIAVGVLTLHHGFGMFVLLGAGVALSAVRLLVLRSPSLAVLDRPLQWTSLTMPMAAVALGIVRHLTHSHVVWMGANSLALLLAAAFYFWRGLETERKSFHVLAAIILNIAIAFLARELTLTDPQFFMIPIGISVLALVELLKREIPESFHNPLRYVGALVILVSPTYPIVGGSWIHLFTLMIASVAIALLAIGLRVRALLYTGTAFLAADLTAMLVRTSMYDANILWIAGLLLGAGIIALGAYCEKHREELISRMHLVASTLKTWE